MQTVNTQQKRQYGSIIGFVAILILVILATVLLEFSYSEAIMAFPNALIWLVQNFYPTVESLANLSSILEALAETVLVSIVAATLASILAFIFAICGAEATKLNNVISVLAKATASFFRNVPDIVWSMIFLFSFGMSIMTGLLALFFVTFGTLTRAFIEVIDDRAGSSVEALVATGGSWSQIIGQAIFPDAISGIISWILYAIENNVRSATLIGLLTGSGIGHVFNLYYKNLDYNACSLVVICIVIIVLTLEAISNRVRRSVL